MQTAPLASHGHVDLRPASGTAASDHRRLRNSLKVLWMAAVLVGCGMALAEAFFRMGSDGLMSPAGAGGTAAAPTPAQ